MNGFATGGELAGGFVVGAVDLFVVDEIEGEFARGQVGVDEVGVDVIGALGEPVATGADSFEFETVAAHFLHVLPDRDAAHTERASEDAAGNEAVFFFNQGAKDRGLGAAHRSVLRRRKSGLAGTINKQRRVRTVTDARGKLFSPIEADIDPDALMDESAGGGEVEAEAGELRKRFQRDATAGFGEGAAGDEGDSFLQLGGREVIEEDDVGAGGEDGGDLGEGVYLDFDGEIGGGFFRAGNGAGEIVERAEEGEVVVLEHDAVEETEAVIPATAAGHGVFFQHAPAGRGLARIQEAGAGFAEGVGVAAGLGGDAAEALEEIEGYAFGREEDAGIAAEGGEDGAFFEKRAVFGAELDGGAAAVDREDEGKQGQTAGDQGFTSDKIRGTLTRGGLQAGGGAVAGGAWAVTEAEAGEIFVTGQLDELPRMGEIEVVPRKTFDERVGKIGAREG
jgi:hypothetical protein